MRASLLIDGPGLWAYNIELSKVDDTLIGRTRAADVVLPDEKVSGKHAFIRFDKEKRVWIVKDLGSSNGTLVNGVRAEETQLRDGDRLRIGSTEALFKDKETRQANKEWDKTVLRMSRHAKALKEALQKKSNDEVVVIPELHLAPSDEQKERAQREDPGAPSSLVYEEDEFDPDRFRQSATEVERAGRTAGDVIWVAEQFAEIIGELAISKEQDKAEIYRMALGFLRDAMKVENGFLMIPNRQTRRWVIEAWVGNNKEWTRYEKEHPVPLTVANDAYRQGTIVSNVYGEGSESISNSASLMQLNVQSYIAITLKREGKKAGLLYFDVRSALVRFQERQVQLAQRVGNYMLEFDAKLETG